MTQSCFVSIVLDFKVGQVRAYCMGFYTSALTNKTDRHRTPLTVACDGGMERVEWNADVGPDVC